MRFKRVAMIVWLVVVISAICPGQDSPAELIDSITRKPESSVVTLMLKACPDTNIDRQTALALVATGAPGLAALESTLDEIEQLGNRSGRLNTHLLLYAYAEIKGRGAVGRLQRMRANDHLSALSIDGALALAFGITAYVSPELFEGSRSSAQSIRRIYCQAPEPSDALRQLIQGIFRNDFDQLSSVLGPRARSTLAISQKIQPTRIAATRAVGFTFEDAGRWSESSGQLRDRSEWPNHERPRFELVTTFVNASGQFCGRLPVTFLEVMNGPADNVFPDVRLFRVDDTNIMDLVGTITGCSM